MDEKEDIKKEEEVDGEGIVEIIQSIVGGNVAFIADTISNVNLYLQIFGHAMRNLRDKEPIVWNELLQSIRNAYAQNPKDPILLIEVIATNVITLESTLLSGKCSSFTNQIYQYGKINNLLFR